MSCLSVDAIETLKRPAKRIMINKFVNPDSITPILSSGLPQRRQRLTTRQTRSSMSPKKNSPLLAVVCSFLHL
jgi:hypothetical protein